MVMPPLADSFAFGYGCIIDAGSSGSRIYLYRWPKENEEKENDKGADGRSFQSSSSPPPPLANVEREAFFSDERSVGITHHGTGGIRSLDELLSSAESALRSIDVDPGTVPIYLGATAGMRLLLLNSESSSSSYSQRRQGRRIMASVRSRLRASGFLFRDDNWARTISGEEESAYGWLVANYLKNDGALPGVGVAEDSSSATAMHYYYGALDLGGASAQISYTLMPDDNSDDDDGSVLGGEENNERREEGGGGGRSFFPLHIGNAIRYSVYTRSYLHYGADQARMRFDATIMSPRTSNNSVNPCYPVGYTDPDTGASGSSNWVGCFDEVAKLFVQQRAHLRWGEGGLLVAIETPSIDDTGQQQQQQQQRFIAMSVFVFVYDFIGLEIGTETEDLRTLRDRATRVCNLTLAQQTAQYDLRMQDRPPGRKTNKPFAQCFNAAYTYHLLSGGFGFPVVGTPMEVYYDINGGKVQWALGMMLVEANRLNSWNEERSSEMGMMMHGGSIVGNATRSYLPFATMTFFLLLVFVLGIPYGRRIIPRLSEKGISFRK